MSSQRINFSSQILSGIQQPVHSILANLALIWNQGRASQNASTPVGFPNFNTGAALDASISTNYSSASGATRPLKPFIVGFIPPDNAVNFIPVQPDTSQIGTFSSGGNPDSLTPPGVDGVRPAGGLPDSFYRALASQAQRIGASPADLLAVLYSESGLQPGITNPRTGTPVIARGLNQLTPSALGMAKMTQDYWQNEYSGLTAEQQLPYVGNFFASAYKGPYTSPTQLYVANFAPAKIASAANPDSVLYSKSANGDNYTKNKQLDVGNKGYITAGDMGAQIQNTQNSAGYQAQLSRLQNVVGKDVALARPGAVTPDVAPAKGGVMAQGGITTQETDDPLSQTGRTVSIATDRLTAALRAQLTDLQSQIDRMLATPGLAMLINPQEFSRSYEHTIDTPKARRGHIVHMWLEKPLSISCKGVSAGQYAMAGDNTGGITHQRRIYSLSYENLMSLVMLYRNNGYVYTHPGGGSDSTNTGIPVLAASLYIYYDGHIYIGSFDDFTVTDEAEKPYNLSYEWKFTVRYDIDVTEITDGIINVGGYAPQYVGAPPVVGVNVPIQTTQSPTQTAPDVISGGNI